MGAFMSKEVKMRFVSVYVNTRLKMACKAAKDLLNLEISRDIL